MTLRLPRLLRWLLVLALSLQSGLAPAQCLRLAAAAPHGPDRVEICTADGLAMVDLGAEHEAPAGHGEAGACLACHGLPQAMLPAPPATPLPALRPVAARQAAPAEAPPPGARAPPYAPRGPPAIA